MYDFYSGKTLPGVFGHFFLIMRIYLTRMGNGHDPFPLWRNVVFNIIREGWCYTYPKLLFDWNNCGLHDVTDFM